MASIGTAQGEKDLDVLLASLETLLDPETFVFLTLPFSKTVPPTLELQMSFREAEGLTAIVTQASAVSHGLEYIFPCRMITLNIHSSLEAIGFIAVIASRLKENLMGVNPVSGFFHDHLFVPEGREEEALDVLREIAADAKKKLAANT
jgi:uncharacterized protein